MKKQAWWKGAKGEWYVVVQMVIFVLLLIAPFILDTPQWQVPFNRIGHISGILLAFVGLGIAFWGVRSLGMFLPIDRYGRQF